MEHYQYNTQATAFNQNLPHLATFPQEKSLKNALALSLIKSSFSRYRLRVLALSYKQIQFHVLRFGHPISPDISFLQKRIKECDDSISEIHQSQLHKEKSMEILRNIKSSLQKKRIPHSQSARPLVKIINQQRNKILDEITEKLQVKNRVPPLNTQKPIETLQLNKRVAKLQTFMQQIKKERERETTEKPAVVLEKQKINRINLHMLGEKLAEQRKKSQSMEKHRQIFTSIQEIKGQLKNMQKTHEALIKLPEKKQDLPEKKAKPQIHHPAEVLPLQKYDHSVQQVIPREDMVRHPARQQLIIKKQPYQLQKVEPIVQKVHTPVFNFYNVMPAVHPMVPPLILPASNNTHYQRPPNTERITIPSSVQFSQQQTYRRPKFSLKT